MLENTILFIRSCLGLKGVKIGGLSTNCNMLPNKKMPDTIFVRILKHCHVPYGSNFFLLHQVGLESEVKKIKILVLRETLIKSNTVHERSVNENGLIC